MKILRLVRSAQIVHILHAHLLLHVLLGGALLPLLTLLVHVLLLFSLLMLLGERLVGASILHAILERVANTEVFLDGVD